MQRADELLVRMKALGDPSSIMGRARFGIPETNSYGLNLPTLRKLAKETGKDVALAKALWDSGIHEARILATLVMPPAKLTRAQAQRWLRNVASWDLCDAVTFNLVDRTEWAYDAAIVWMNKDDEWTKRAGFGLIAGLAAHDKDSPDARFADFFPVIEARGDDERNFVKKAASWALRCMGKRSPWLRRKAMASARRMKAKGGKGARWIASDVLRELDRT
jgi:3-methyladenine DNA glycosylase AlkD